MDNSPRFDIHAGLQAIDFSCFMANEIRYMQKIAYELNDSENKLLSAWFNRKGDPVEPYDFKAKIQSIRDYGWSCTLVFDLLYNMFS